MNLSNLFSSFFNTGKKEETKPTQKKSPKKKNVKEAVKKIAKNETVRKTAKKAVKKVVKTGKTACVDVAKILTPLMKNKDVANALANIAAKKKNDPASTTVQKLVSSLKNVISKNVGAKIDNETFSKVVNKLMSNATVKSKVEKLAGAGVSTFVKKAVSEFVK